MADIQTISIAIASASVVAGVVYYALQLRNQTRIRKTDMIMRLYSTLHSREHTEARTRFIRLQFKDYNDFIGKYDANGPEMIDLLMVGNYLNEVGMLLHKGLIDIESVYDLLGYRVANLWEKMKPITEEWRKDEPQTAKWFEYLHNEIEKYEQKLQQAGVRNG